MIGNGGGDIVPSGVFTPLYGTLMLSVAGTIEVVTAGNYYVLNETLLVGSTINSISSGVTASDADGTLTITEDGIYEIVGSFSFSGTGGALVHVDPFVDGVEASDGGFERKIGVGGDVGAASLVATLSLTAGNVLDFRITSDDNSDDITFAYFVIAAKRIA